LPTLLSYIGDPAIVTQAVSVRLGEICESFAASCGHYTCGVELFEHMGLYSAAGTSRSELRWREVTRLFVLREVI